MVPFDGWGSIDSGLEPLKEEVYFLPLSSQKFLVLILSTLERWKAKSSLELLSSFEQGNPGLRIQRLKH